MENLKYKKILTKETIHRIEEIYRITITKSEQLFLGADSNTFVYKTKTKDNKTYFLKIRTGDFYESSIIIPHLLFEKTGKHIIDPVKTSDGDLYTTIDDNAVILYPFIYGTSGRESPFSGNQWIEFGKLLCEIHNTRLPENTLSIPRESWNTKWQTQLKKIMKEIPNCDMENKYTQEFIELLNTKNELLHELTETSEKLILKIKNGNYPFCLCHGDIHAGNILMTGEDYFYVVDWDTLIMAPKERDLMFIGGGVANMWNREDEEKEFYNGYGKNDDVDLEVLVYYRYIRIIEDIVVYYEEFFRENNSGANKKAIIDRVESAFVPGGVVEMALKAKGKYMYKGSYA